MNHSPVAASWAPYMTWAKHHTPARYDLCGSNLLHCTLDDLPGARESLELSALNDEGYPPLVEAIARRYGVGTERVATATGAAGAGFLALGALVRPGDRVLAEWPGYDPHSGAARLLGAEVKTFKRSWDNGFQVDVDEVAKGLSTRVKAVIFTNLHNPSGVYTDPESLAAIADIADVVGAKVIVDEVYLEAIPNRDTAPAAGRSDAFISVNSLTKSFGLAGLRTGWALADADTIEGMRRVRDVVDGVGAVPAERLGALAFEHIDSLLARAHAILDTNAHMVRDFVESRDDLEWVPPAPGSPIAFPRLVHQEDADAFVEMAHREFGVGVAPGSFFGAPAHFRLAAAGETQVVHDGLEALGKALDKGW